jgi:hypothetical protein
MTRILANLTAFNLLVMLATYAVGWTSFAWGGYRDDSTSIYPLHLFLGLLAGTTALGVHCLIFIYFLGTGRWVKEVAIAYRIPDDPLPKLTRTLKRQTFPPALFAMLIVIGTTVAGAWAATSTSAHGPEATRWWPWPVHALAATVALAINVWAFFVEYRAVAINGRVIDEVMREVDRIRAEQGLPSNEEALRQEQEAT